MRNMRDITGLRKALNDNSKRLGHYISRWASAKRNFEENLSTNYQKFAERIRFNADGVLEKANPSINRIRKMLIETKEDVESFQKVIAELGYPPHLIMDIPTIRSIVKSYNAKELTIENIDKFMCSYYDSEMISRIGLNWEHRDELQPRLSILRNVIMAHNLGLYGVSVPAIISQFEGVLADGFKIKGKADGCIVNIMLENLLNNNEGWRGKYDKSVLKYYNKNLLTGFEHGKKISSIISRNAILHGSDVNFDTEDISIRAILLFDYISERIEDIDEQDIINADKEIKNYRKEKREKNRNRNQNRRKYKR